jgi:hypothetical protein
MDARVHNSASVRISKVRRRWATERRGQPVGVIEIRDMVAGVVTIYKYSCILINYLFEWRARIRISK